MEMTVATENKIMVVPMTESKYHIVKMENEVRACGQIAFLDDFALMVDVRSQSPVESNIPLQKHFSLDYKNWREPERCKSSYAKVIKQMTVRKDTIKQITSFDSPEDLAGWVLREKEQAIEVANSEERTMNVRRLEATISNYKHFKEDFRCRWCRSEAREAWNKLSKLDKFLNNENKWTDKKYEEINAKFDFAVLKKWFKDNKDVDMDELEALL